jgi:two-component system sensor histidine kinase GlrK
VYYPRSFLKFILLGFLLVSLPLVYALAELIISLERLQAQGQEAVQQAAQAGRNSRQLFEQASTLERIVRQHLILEDPALLDDYGRVQQEFRQTMAELATLPLEPPQQAALGALSDSEVRLQKLLVAPQRGVDVQAQLAQGYARLTDGAQATLASTNQVTERAIVRLEETASQGRQKWLYLAVATAAIAIALAIVFAVLIARPIRQLDLAIRQMGTADFTHAIEVNGPQDMRYLGQRLEWLRSRLHELEEQQNRFLRHVSHELKTPLTAVREGAELLRDRVAGDLSPGQKEIVRIVRENTLQLQKLIEDLLTYHQTRAIESQAQESVALPDVVRQVIKEHKLAAFARMVTIDAQLPPAQVVGNPDRIRTIVDNLLSNAIKYSPRSGVIALNLAQEEGFAVLDVIDQGHGVDPGERERIFESFYQGRPPTEGRVKGSGLGLAIAREYALAHGGRIEVRDRPDRRRGAQFRLSLPLAAEANASGADAAAAHSAATATSAADPIAGRR